MGTSRKSPQQSVWAAFSKPKHDARRNRTKANGSGTSRVRGVHDPKPKQRFTGKAVKSTRGKK